MKVKTIAICAYIMLIYWASLHFSFLDTLFFPTLGAFSFLFISRSFLYRELARITVGAFISSAVGTLLFYIYPSAIMVFANVLITIGLIRKFQWNAPPIVAVSLVPFFSHSTHHWVIPLSACVVLLGLMLILFIAEKVDTRFGHLLEWRARKELQTKSESLDLA